MRRRNTRGQADLANDISNVRNNINATNTFQITKRDTRKIRLGYGSDDGDMTVIKKYPDIIQEEIS